MAGRLEDAIRHRSAAFAISVGGRGVVIGSMRDPARPGPRHQRPLLSLHPILAPQALGTEALPGFVPSTRAWPTSSAGPTSSRSSSPPSSMRTAPACSSAASRNRGFSSGSSAGEPLVMVACVSGSGKSSLAPPASSPAGAAAPRSWASRPAAPCPRRPGQDFRARVVLTMRRDYYNLISTFPELYDRLEADGHAGEAQRLGDDATEPVGRDAAEDLPSAVKSRSSPLRGPTRRPGGWRRRRSRLLGSPLPKPSLPSGAAPESRESAIPVAASGCAG